MTRGKGSARFKGRKPAVDPVKRDAAGNQLAEHQRAVEIGTREQGKIPPRASITIADAADALFLHQRAPAERDVLVDVDLAEPDDLAAGPHGLGGDPTSRAAPGPLGHHARPPAA